MNCEQKSGLLLNASCSNTASSICINCEKQLCKQHTFVFGQPHCENCFWSEYLIDGSHENDKISIPKNIDNPGSGKRTVDTSFGGGQFVEGGAKGNDFSFGGGQFGGGGATGDWDETDLSSFDSTDEFLSLKGGDDSFFYS